MKDIITDLPLIVKDSLEIQNIPSTDDTGAGADLIASNAENQNDLFVPVKRRSSSPKQKHTSLVQILKFSSLTPLLL